jgi:putative transposase
MEDKTNQELALRRRAIRLKLRGLRPSDILRRIPRGRTWLFRWLKRFACSGWPGLKNKSKQPKHSSQAYPLQSRTVVLGLRRAMHKRRLGLLGARAIQQEIRQQKLLNHLPSVATINRWLRTAGLLSPPVPAPAAVFYPEPRAPTDYVLHAMDWTARYLEGGQKVFAFHSVNVVTRALAQTIATDKTGRTLHQHVLHAWQVLGLPDGLQLDNDITFTGGERTPRRFGSFVRLCLYLGIELVFVPPAEPNRNGVVEGVNSLWARSFWNRYRFRSLQAVVSRSPQFLTWYMTQYHPPVLEGRTPAQAQRTVRRQRLTRQQLHALPEQLPITAGRIHFIRRVNAAGEIRFLGENWKVGKRFAHQYVWATVSTQCQRLEIHHRCAAQAAAKLVRRFSYEILEPVRPLHPEFKRRPQDRKKSPML